MPRAVSRSIALTVALLAIVACEQERSAAPQGDAPAEAAPTELVQEIPHAAVAVVSVAELREPVASANPIVISDKLALKELPASFAPLAAPNRIDGRSGERTEFQLFSSAARHGTVTVWITIGQRATDLLIEPHYKPSTLSARGLSLFELQNQTTLTSNVIAWSIGPGVVVGVTSRDLTKAELLEWVSNVDAQP
ncbi:MAG: hypothetical protein ABIQ73_14735 [Acidimicrobiales bacterium]